MQLRRRTDSPCDARLPTPFGSEGPRCVRHALSELHELRHLNGAGH